MEMCTVELHRVSQLSYGFAPFYLMLDGEDIGRIRNGEVFQFLASPGPHELCVYSWHRCIGRTRFTIPEGQPFEYITLQPSSWSGRVAFSRGISYSRQERHSGSTAADVLLLILLLLVLVPVLLYLLGVRPFVVFFPLS